MASIKFSNGLVKQAVSGAMNAAGTLYLMKGAMPTVEWMKGANSASNFTSTTSGNRGSDLLCTLLYATGVVSNNTVTFPQTVYATAAASGEATWFASYNSNSRVFFGDISLLDGNGMLKMPTTNIVAGGSYRVMQIQLSLPYEYNL
jgi:hypothetical protein